MSGCPGGVPGPAPSTPVVGSDILSRAMPPQLFLPNARQTNWLLMVGFLSLGEALYVRYLAIEHAQVALACQAGLNTWLCATFRLAIILYNHSVFGWVALGGAALNLMRPSVVLVTVALAAAAVYVAINESFANWQALWFSAGLLAFALTLLRAPDAPS